MLDTDVLVLVLVAAGISSLAAGTLTVRALIETRRDLAHVIARGIGNGRRAAAVGEHRLAWSRLGQAALSLALTSLLIYIATIHAGLDSRVPGVWVAVVGMVALASAGLCWQAVAAGKIRRQVLHLGIVEDLASDGERLTGVVDDLQDDQQRLGRRLDEEGL